MDERGHLVRLVRSARRLLRPTEWVRPNWPCHAIAVSADQVCLGSDPFVEPGSSVCVNKTTSLSDAATSKRMVTMFVVVYRG